MSRAGSHRPRRVKVAMAGANRPYNLFTKERFKANLRPGFKLIQSRHDAFNWLKTRTFNLDFVRGYLFSGDIENVNDT